ncbi:hypothetical protein PVAP13_5NG523986 [Panicum virgatum]|uniref:Uncharacterized protein n=1 Tax=Panicum virgatum TaxID=38727 RepID=A0A8T0S5K5_PANVG|nr:hypothetical protein PVAP13_5NG523986 [Panicum virgatum]
MKTDEQFDRILKMLEENKQGLVEIKSAMTEMRVAKDEFEAWKPGVDKSVADLQIAVDNLGVRFDQLVSASPSAAKRTGFSTDLPTSEIPESVSQQAPVTAHMVTTSKEAASGPHGHREESYNRGSGFGVVYTVPHPPPVTDQDVSS